MYPSTSSYRTSASTSRLLRRTLRGQEGGASDTTTDVPTINSRSRGYSHDQSTSGKSSVSSFSSSTASERRQKSPSSYSDSIVMVFLRSLFTRCFTKRRKRRKRGLATRKMKNNNYQTRDDYGNVHGANPKNSYASIPTNEHEMFFQLHSKSKRPQNAKPLTGPPSPRLYARERINLNEAKPPARSIIPHLLIIEQRSEGQPLLLS